MHCATSGLVGSAATGGGLQGGGWRAGAGILGHTLTEIQRCMAAVLQAAVCKLVALHTSAMYVTAAAQAGHGATPSPLDRNTRAPPPRPGPPCCGQRTASLLGQQ